MVPFPFLRMNFIYGVISNGGLKPTGTYFHFTNLSWKPRLIVGPYPFSARFWHRNIEHLTISHCKYVLGGRLFFHFCSSLLYPSLDLTIPTVLYIHRLEAESSLSRSIRLSLLEVQELPAKWFPDEIYRSSSFVASLDTTDFIILGVWHWYVQLYARLMCTLNIPEANECSLYRFPNFSRYSSRWHREWNINTYVYI